MQEKMRGRWGMGQQEGERKSSQLSHDRWSLVKKSTNLSNKVFFSLVTEIQTSFLLLSVCNACMLLVYMCWWLMISLIIDIGTCSFCSVLRRRLCLHSSNKHFKIGSAEFQKVWAVFHPDHFAMHYFISNTEWINPRCFWFQNALLIYVWCIILGVIHAIEMSTKSFKYWTNFFSSEKTKRNFHSSSLRLPFVAYQFSWILW